MAEKQQLFTHLTDEDIAREEVKKDGDDIIYLLLLEGVDTENDSVWKDWCFVTGRTNAYIYIRDALLANETETCILDACKSLIYADNPHIEKSKLKLSTPISFYKFIKNCDVTGNVSPEVSEGFDIDDYYVTDEIPDNN